MTLSSSAPSLPAFEWHPKLTPYRLTFIFIIGGLGITKAALVSRNEVASSITLEWITGVVVVLSFQFLDVYENKLHRSPHIDWVFTYDCLNIVKIFLQILKFNGDNQSTPANFDQPMNTEMISNLPPIATAYRLMVSTTVSIFGIAKMTCGYLGLSAAMSTFDWIVAIPLTLGLYYIGLYEETHSSVPRTLFDIEYSSKARLWLFFIGAVSTCLCWLSAWSLLIREAIIYYGEVESDMLNIPVACLIRSMQLMGILFFLAMLEIGTWALAVVLCSVDETRGGRHATSIREYTDHVAGLILHLFCAIFFMAYTIFALSFAALFLCPNVESAQLRLFDIILAVIMMSTTVLPAKTAYWFTTEAITIYNKYPLNFSAVYRQCIRF